MCSYCYDAFKIERLSFYTLWVALSSVAFILTGWLPSELTILYPHASVGATWLCCSRGRNAGPAQGYPKNTGRDLSLLGQCLEHSCTCSGMVLTHRLGVLELTNGQWHKAQDISLRLWQIHIERKDRWLKTAIKYSIPCLRKPLDRAPTCY